MAQSEPEFFLNFPFIFSENSIPSLVEISEKIQVYAVGNLTLSNCLVKLSSGNYNYFLSTNGLHSWNMYNVTSTTDQINVEIPLDSGDQSEPGVDNIFILNSSFGAQPWKLFGSNISVTGDKLTKNQIIAIITRKKFTRKSKKIIKINPNIHGNFRGK